MNDRPKPDWWPECPWPEDIFTRKATDVVKDMQDASGDIYTDFIAGPLMRHGWQLAEKEILERLKERGIEL